MTLTRARDGRGDNDRDAQHHTPDHHAKSDILIIFDLLTNGEGRDELDDLIGEEHQQETEQRVNRGRGKT